MDDKKELELLVMRRLLEIGGNAVADENNNYTDREINMRAALIIHRICNHFKLELEPDIVYPAKAEEQRQDLLNDVKTTSESLIAEIAETILENQIREKIKNPYEEALLIQEKYGFNTNVVKWDHDDFLQYLQKEDPKNYKKILICKELVDK